MGLPSLASTECVACNRTDTQSPQPFVDATCTDSGNHLVADRSNEATRPDAQVAEISRRHSICPPCRHEIGNELADFATAGDGFKMDKMKLGRVTKRFPIRVQQLVAFKRLDAAGIGKRQCRRGLARAA